MHIARKTIVLSLLAMLLTPILSTPIRAQGRINAEAVVGQPFGVGRITFLPPQGMLPEPLGIEGIGIAERNGRVLYPALDSPAFGKVMKELLDGGTPLTTGGPVRREVGGLLRGFLDRPPRTTLYFLFRGDEPLELSLQTRSTINLKIVPLDDADAHRQLMQLWWEQYVKIPSVLEPKSDDPPMVENYLTSMLARRLNLRLPEEKQADSPYATLRNELGLNLGAESLRMAMMQDRILGLNNWGQPADQPLPAPVDTPDLLVPEPASDVAVEPIAMRVPAECFYVRFGSFSNFLWLQDTLAKWGGDAQNLIALRGLDRDMSGQMEKQLVLKQTVLSRMLGDTVITDVAIIGTDMFFHEGACYGILFHARNNLGLSTSLNQQRLERKVAGGVTEETLQIDGHAVSFLSSHDGRVRSYYVTEGDYHFVATSKNLVARFLATASGSGSLGATREFRHARTIMPLDRNDTIWLYLSDAFFRNITGPRYRVEMARRLQAAADLELVELARLAAVAEGCPGDTIKQLKKASLLPPEFKPLPDGSHVALEAGEAYDTLRGRRGAFLPVDDVPIDKVTQSEASEYKRFAEFYRTHWGRMDPVIAGVKRKSLDKNLEQVTVDVRMSPFAPQHFDTLKQWLGKADNLQLAPIAGDMAALDLVLTDQRIFGGLRDIGPGANVGVTSWLPLGKLRDLLSGYVGTTGELGMLSVLNLGISPHPDPAGYAGSPLGGWRRQYGDFIVFSFQHEVLETVVPQLRFERVQRPAQVRLRIGDVSHARITPVLNDLGYARTRETSLNNLRFLHTLDQQLHVPPAACRETAEFLLDAKMVCPLGGKYVPREANKEPPHWTSTALNPAESGGFLKVHAPKGYQSPPLSWFRGLDLDAMMTEKTITAHAEVIMQMPAKK